MAKNQSCHAIRICICVCLVVLVWFFDINFANAQKTGAINFNTPTNKLRYYDGTAWIDMGSTTSLGACTRAGTIGYNVANSVMTYCNGTNEIDLTVQVSANLCSRAGAFDFDSGLNTYRFCNGANWVNTTTPVLNHGFFVMTNGTYNANRGGRAGADATCLTELTNNDWLGKSSAQSFGLLTASHVYAFLCDSATGCLNLDQSTTYRFARAGSSTSGGASFTTDASSFAPNNSSAWSGSTFFDVTADYWTGRNPGTTTLWSRYPDDNSHCSNWGSTAGSARYGRSTGTDSQRWSRTTAICSTNSRLICVVFRDPEDFVPDAFSFPDLTNQSQGILVESAIVQINGFTGPMVIKLASVETPSGLIEARVCADSSCASVITNWSDISTVGLQISGANYLQLRRQTPGNANVSRNVLIQIGDKSDTWTITTDPGGDSTPDSFNFPDLVNQAQDTDVFSSIVQISGITAAEVNGNGTGGSVFPIQFRICADSSCSTVITNWRYDPAVISNNQYIQLRATTPSGAGSTISGNVFVGNVSDNWSVSTTPNTSWGAFVLLDANYTGSALGSLANADATCLTRLTADSFAGKLNVTLNSTKVKAFLCDNTTCNNLAPNTTYMFASVRWSGEGGATFTTNASGQGPNDSIAWGDVTRFVSSYDFWTGRAAGTATLWSLSSSGNTCSNWSSTSGNGTYGNAGSGNTTSNRWSVGAMTCATVGKLICFVNP